jgi:hypothetical protein
MARVRRCGLLLLVALALAGCGGSSTPDLTKAADKTIAEKSAGYTLNIDAVIAGRTLRSSERGTISFAEHRGHIYRLIPGGGLPRELIVDGPWVYSNSNLEAAMQDTSVKPWTRLDTRRKQVPDEVAHVRALVYLADGVAQPLRVEGRHFRGRVDPQRITAPGIAAALRNDYPAKPFLADFWLDADGRIERVRVRYRTDAGTPITLDGTFGDFGAEVDVAPPPAADVEDITRAQKS